MKRLILTIIILVFLCPVAYCFSVSCNYEKGFAICNGYKLKDVPECKDKDLSNIIILKMIPFNGLNSEAQKERLEGESCIEYYIPH